ncbi:MAG: glycosyltransferase family 2 protein [Clostridia bacterium]|nr:glycosyltransferase family 2 protein [Clostridia bacterium]
MKFSILVPVYNVEQYLEQCVESLLNQTYQGDYEIILVDDGSTDSSGKICDKFKENNSDKIKVIHKENGGHTSARLEAIKNASGEYCLFCDSDDFVESDLLETVNNVLSDNPDTDMVMYSFCYYEEGKKTRRNISVWNATEIFEGNEKKKLYNLLITTPHINSLCTKAIKTELLKNDPTDYSVLKDKDIAEDAYIVSCFVTACKKIININESLYNYRTNRKSISRSYNPQKIDRKNMLFLYRRFVELLPVWEMNDEETLNTIYKSCFSNAMYLFRMHYKYANNKQSRKLVLEYNWNSMLFDEIITEPQKYANPTNIRLYEMVSDKQYFRLKVWFLKNRIYQCVKKTKKKIRGV